MHIYLFAYGSIYHKVVSLITASSLVLKNVCLPKTVFSNSITESSFSMFYSKSHSLTITISESGLKNKNLIFRYIALYRIEDIYYESRNNPLVNSRPEIHLILVNTRNTRSMNKGNQRTIEMLLCQIALRVLTLINTKNHQHTPPV